MNLEHTVEKESRRHFLGRFRMLALGAPLLFFSDDAISYISSAAGKAGKHSKHKKQINYKTLKPPSLGWLEIEREDNYKNVELEDKDTTIGRIQRAMRWKPITDEAERKYGIKKNMLLAMIMQESYGDPIQPNMSKDGGLGLMHMQPVVAHECGLKVYGNSSTLASKKYGVRLSDELLEPCKYDMKKIYASDERIHPIKNIDAGARIVKTGHNIHKSWDLAAEFYRAPGSVGKGTGQRYLAKVNRWLAALDDPKTMAAAEDDFNRRNHGKQIIGTSQPLTFQNYLEGFRDICNNYGLGKYKRLKMV